MEDMGREKLHFSLLELAKCQKGPLGKSVSTDFVTNVAIIIHKSIKTFLLLISTHSSFLRARYLSLHFRSNEAIIKQTPDGGKS